MRDVRDVRDVIGILAGGAVVLGFAIFTIVQWSWYILEQRRFEIIARMFAELES